MNQINDIKTIDIYIFRTLYGLIFFCFMTLYSFAKMEPALSNFRPTEQFINKHNRLNENPGLEN